jgi:hypothetical protein
MMVLSTWCKVMVDEKGRGKGKKSGKMNTWRTKVSFIHCEEKMDRALGV